MSARRQKHHRPKPHALKHGENRKRVWRCNVLRMLRRNRLYPGMIVKCSAVFHTCTVHMSNTVSMTFGYKDLYSPPRPLRTFGRRTPITITLPALSGVKVGARVLVRATSSPVIVQPSPGDSFKLKPGNVCTAQVIITGETTADWAIDPGMDISVNPITMWTVE